MSKYLAKLKALREISASPGNCQNCQNLGKPGFDSFDSTHGSSLSRLKSPFTEAGEPNPTGWTHGHERAPETLDLAQAGRDHPEERGAISEFDEGLPRAEAEAIARREMAGVYDMQAECDPGSYAFALAALRATCPAYVPDDRWRQAIATPPRSSPNGADKPRRSAGRRASCSAYTPRLSDRWQATATSTLRRDGLNLAAARTPRCRPDGNGCGHSGGECRAHVSQAKQAGTRPGGR